MQHYAHQGRDTDLLDHATEIRLRAERRAAELDREREKQFGARGSESNRYEVRSHAATSPTLAEFGVTKRKYTAGVR
jgi:hypothetical protein